MTKKEFLRNALLQIAGSGVFGKPNYHYMIGWAKDVEQAAAALLDVAIDNHCLEDDEPDKPP